MWIKTDKSIGVETAYMCSCCQNIIRESRVKHANYCEICGNDNRKKKSLWISSKDELPRTTGECLIWYEYDGLWGRFADYGIAWYNGSGWELANLEGDNKEVLYWQPLPEKPVIPEDNKEIANTIEFKNRMERESK